MGKLKEGGGGAEDGAHQFGRVPRRFLKQIIRDVFQVVAASSDQRSCI
jgi:hypothetical protein